LALEIRGDRRHKNVVDLLALSILTVRASIITE